MSSLWNTESTLVQGALSSLIFLAAILISRYVLMRLVVHGRELPEQSRRWWSVTIRNALALVFLIGLVFIWAEELRSFAVSVVAVAVAFAIVTKELLMCLIGTVLRTLTRSYSIGDHIEISDAHRTHAGYVVDQSMLTTTIEETGPVPREQSGRRVVLPNSLFVTWPLTTDLVTGGCTLQTVTVPVAAGDDVIAAERALLAIAEEECAGMMTERPRGRGERTLAETTLAPRVTLELPDPETVHLLLRVPVPAREQGDHVRTILRRFLTERSSGVGPT